MVKLKRIAEGRRIFERAQETRYTQAREAKLCQPLGTCTAARRLCLYSVDTKHGVLHTDSEEETNSRNCTLNVKKCSEFNNCQV